MREIIVKQSEEGQRLNKFLMKYLDKAPSSFVYKMLRKKNIVLNDKKASGNEIVSVNDSIKLYLAEDTIVSFKSQAAKNASNPTEASNKLQANFKILYKDNDMIAVHKPAGILSQKADTKDYSVNDYIIEYYNKLEIPNKSSIFKPSICNRLDRNTSGIIMAGISLKGSQNISKIMKDRTADKYYYTIVSGQFSKAGYHKAFISKDKNINKSEVISENDYNILNQSNQANYNQIETQFEVISANNRFSLLKIKLITGKSHQIRAHLKYLGHPIIGDSKYGNQNTNRYVRDNFKLKHHLLHSGSITINNITINDPLPQIYYDICKKEGLNCSL